jgi:hypothetical protein
VAASAHRQIARSAGCHHSTVGRRSQRLGRHASLLHQLLLRALPSTDEPIIVDDFDTYAGSQYFPCTLPTAVGSRSWFVYGFAFARERRRGHMSPRQRHRRARLERLYGRPERGAVRKAFDGLIVGLPHPPRHIIADDDPAIRAALSSRPGVRFDVHPNPCRGPKGSRRSAQAWLRDQAMFPNDQLHRFLRHTQAAHRRETIAFGRSYNGLRERMALFVIWRNLVQARSERRPRDGTTAMYLKATSAPWPWARVLARRLQPSRVRPSEAVWQLYRRTLQTPGLLNERRHTLTRAF